MTKKNENILFDIIGKLTTMLYLLSDKEDATYGQENNTVNGKRVKDLKEALFHISILRGGWDINTQDPATNKIKGKK